MKALSITKAVVSGFILVVTAYYLIMLVLEPLSDKNPNMHDALIPWVNILIPLMYVGGGFVAGTFSRQLFIVSGLIVGLLSAFFINEIFANGGYGYEYIVSLIFCTVLGGIGGTLSLLIFKSRVANGL